jgi:hypothetical protein
MGYVALWPCHLTLKKVSLDKRRIIETQKYFTMQKYNLQKNPLKFTTKILQDIRTQ